jgi:uncharacterized protein (DUF934 family)
MPKLIKLASGKAAWADDGFVAVGLEDPVPASGDVILPLSRYEAEAPAILAQGRKVGVRLEGADEIEALAPFLADLSVVALGFPKFRDGRAFSSARLLRERFAYHGEIRAVGEVLRELASFMIRCGFDAFEPADGSTPEEWAATAHRYRHVYQRAADSRAPAFVEREA